MASDHLTPDGLILPTPQPAKVIGILNIVFALIAMGMGLCCSVYTPVSMPMAQAQQQQAVAQQQAARQASIASLRDEEKAAPSEEAKRQIRARIQMMESWAQPASPEVDLVKLGLQDPRYIGHFAADLASNLILNLLMFIAGIGLIRLKEWGRSLGVWVAALKIARLLALTASMIVVVVPFVTQKAADFASEVEAQEAARKGQPGPRPSDLPPRQLAEFIKTAAGWAAGYAAGMLILGAIYPAISLVALTRPGVKVACLPQEPAW